MIDGINKSIPLAFSNQAQTAIGKQRSAKKGKMQDADLLEERKKSIHALEENLKDLHQTYQGMNELIFQQEETIITSTSETQSSKPKMEQAENTIAKAEKHSGCCTSRCTLF